MTLTYSKVAAMSNKFKLGLIGCFYLSLYIFLGGWEGNLIWERGSGSSAKTLNNLMARKQKLMLSVAKSIYSGWEGIHRFPNVV